MLICILGITCTYKDPPLRSADTTVVASDVVV
jgi:hypothetical protein